MVDEARHVEVFSPATLHDKLGMTVFPPAPLVRDILAELIKSPEWDVKYLGCRCCSRAWP